MAEILFVCVHIHKYMCILTYTPHTVFIYIFVYFLDFFTFYTYIAIFVDIHSVHRHIHISLYVCVYIYMCGLYMCIRHAQKFLGCLGVI